MDGSNATNESRKCSAVTHALTPEAMLKLVRLEQAGPYAVRGYARNLKLFPAAKPSHCYGDLELTGSRVKFRVPVNSTPQEGASIVIRGAMGLSRSNEVLLFGDVDGAWAPNEPIGVRLQPRQRTRPPLSLLEFVESNAYTQLGFLVTYTAWEDIWSTVGTGIDLRECTALTPGFSDASAFAHAIRHVSAIANVGAIVIACGGNDRIGEIGNSPEVLDTLLECGRPFYVAMGHANDMLAIDKYADERFAMPGDFGHKLRRSVERVQVARRQSASLSAKEEQLVKARDQIALLQQQLVAATATQQAVGKSALTWQTLLAILGAAMLVAWLLARLLH